MELLSIVCIYGMNCGVCSNVCKCSSCQLFVPSNEFRIALYKNNLLLLLFMEFLQVEEHSTSRNDL